MDSPTRAQLVRTAVLIERVITSRVSRVEPEELPSAAWQRCERLAELTAFCRDRGWKSSIIRCELLLQRAINEFGRQLQILSGGGRRTRTRPATVRELFDDLRDLPREFSDLTIDLKHSSLAVVTDPVVMEGLDLGRFQIVLDWKQLGSRSAYGVIALDPCPAQVNSSVTHPHVSDRRLCEGEASAAIRCALDAGRLLDFFTIVAQTLATYNPGSAFVELDRWSGATCTDCGDLADEPTCCERCESELCGGCASCCESCGRYACAECSASCAACHQNQCGTCLTSCRTCHEDSCERCLTDEQCEQCREQAAELDSETPEEIAAG